MNNNLMNPNYFYQLLISMLLKQQNEINQYFNGNQQFNILNQPNQYQKFFIPQNYYYNSIPNQNPFQLNIAKNFYQVNYNVNKTENDFNTINHHYQNTVNQNNIFNQTSNSFFNNNIQLNDKNNNNFKIIKDENIQLNIKEKSDTLIENNNEKTEILLDESEKKDKNKFLEKKRKENEIIENNIEKKKPDNDISDKDFEITEMKKRKNKRKKGKKIISQKCINNNINKSDKNNKINTKINNNNKNNSNNNIIHNNNDISIKKSNSKNTLNPIINMHLRSKNNNTINNTTIKNQEIINIQSPEAESILLNDFQNHLNDKFFDLVNNKKHTKKYRELNYISSTNPKDFMEENFYKKMKEKFIPRTKEIIKLCDNIPKFHSSSINDIKKPVICSYNYKTFKELNKDLKIKEVLNQIEKIWPKNSIKCYDDRILNFIAICNYNIDLAIEHIKNRTREFLSYIDELNRQNLNIENTIINQDNNSKKEKNRK